MSDRPKPTCLNCGREVKRGVFCALCRPIVAQYGRQLLPSDRVKELLKRQVRRAK